MINFNLTIQEAIEVMKNGIYCICELNPTTKLKIKDDNYYAEREGESWTFTYIDNYFICAKWAIYEEPKQSTPLIQFKENGIKIECYVAHNTSYGHDSYTARFWLENFKKQEECNDWRKALNTFMRLKCNPLAEIAADNKRQWLIEIGSFEEIIKIDEYDYNFTKLINISPCFSTKEDAESAITDIGEENLLHMFKTFQGIYE